MNDRFSICLPYTLAQECPHPENWSDIRNFSNDAHDHGGETMCGITQREYDAYRKSYGDFGICRDVRQCSEDEGKSIYYLNYWIPHCRALPPGLDLQFFDSSVNEGCVEAVRILQWVRGISVDGLWGPETAATIGRIENVEGVIRAFTDRRKEVYRESRGFQYFGKDWLRRADEIGATALKMAVA